ncbi:MAG: hypothetical protein ACI4I9_10620 [Porcipelethomonas sp.]
MAKKKRLGVSVFVVILTVLMLCVILFTAMVNFKFSSSAESGTLFGKHIFVFETEDMAPEIDKGSAVIADSDDIQVLTEGNVILFSQGEGFESVMRIREVIHNTDNTVYKVAYDADPDNVIEVNKKNVIAKCDTESQNLGKLITFLKSTVGLLVGLLLPCVLLLVLIIVKLVSVRKGSEEDEEYEDEFDEDFDNDEDEYEEEDSLLRKRVNPLFTPDANINQGEEFERKKSSIAKNFAQKPGAVRSRGRIPSEKTAENAVERFKAAVEDKPSAPVTRKATLAPDGANHDKNEKMAAIKAALSQGESLSSERTKTIESKTMKIKITDERKAEPVQEPVLNKTADNRSAVSKPSAPKPVQKKKSDDIKSIDDLIKLLEAEKKKL